MGEFCCPRCELLIDQPAMQRDHRCPRCLAGSGQGVIMKPLASSLPRPRVRSRLAPTARSFRRPPGRR